MHASRYIGRVGGLAVALGIGAALSVGGADMAWASPEDSATASDETASGAAGSPRGRAEGRRGRPAQIAPRATEASGRAGDNDSAEVKPVRPKSAKAASPSPAATVSAPAVPAAAVPGAAAPTSAVAANRAVPVESVAAPAVVPSFSATADRASTAAVPAVAAVAPASAPAMVAAAPPKRAAAIGVVQSFLAPLLGSGGTGAPAQSPVSWVMLAAARRDLGVFAAPAAPSAAITTGQLVSPAATAAPVANKPPVISGVTLGAANASTGAVVGTVKASDPEGSKLTYKATTSTKGAVTITTAGVFTYTPTATARHAAAKVGATTAVTADTVTVTVTDAKGAVATRAVTVPISPKNTAPTGAKATVGTPNATTGVVSGTVSATDADKDVLTYSAPTATAKGAVAINAGSGVFTYTPTAVARQNAGKAGAPAADKSDDFTVTVTDGYGGTNRVVVTVPVSPTSNRAPVPGTAKVGTPNAETGVVTGNVTATDADGDALTYQGPTTTNKGGITVSANGSFTYTPTAVARHAAAKNGAAVSARSDTFAITVSDGKGGTAAIPVTVTISPFNRAPVEGTPSAVINPTTGVVTGNVNAVDPDKDVLTYFAGSGTSVQGTITVTATGDYTYAPTDYARHAAAMNGATSAETMDIFRIDLTDNYGQSTWVPLWVPVSPRNAAPKAQIVYQSDPDPATAVVKGIITVSDDDGDDVYYSVPTSTAKGAITLNSDGAFTYTPTAAARYAAAGATAADKTDTFAVSFTDDYGGATELPITVSILPAATPPSPPVTVKFKPGYVSVSEGNGGLTKVPVTVQLSAPSASPVTVSYSVVEQPLLSTAATRGEDFLGENGSVTIAAGQTEATFQATVYGDTRYEADELVRVELTGASGGVLDTNPSNYRQTITILNDDKVGSAAAVVARSPRTAALRPRSATLSA